MEEDKIEVYEFKKKQGKNGLMRTYITAKLGNITATAQVMGVDKVSGVVEYHIIRNRETLEGLTVYDESGRRKRTKGTKVDPAGDIDAMIKLRDYMDSLR